MEVYINMNNSKINNPNDMYKLFKKNFIKVLDIKEYFMAVIIVIVLFSASILYYYFTKNHNKEYIFFIILVILHIIIEINVTVFTNNKKIKEKSEKIIKEVLQNNFVQINYKTITLLQSNSEIFNYKNFFKKPIFLIFKQIFSFFIAILIGIFSAIVTNIIKYEIYKNDFYSNLQDAIYFILNILFLIINFIYIIYFFYLLVLCINGNLFFKKIYTETLNDINFKLKLEEYNKNNEENVKKSENNVNKIKVKINFKKIKKIDNDKILNNPIKQKISYFYYQKQNRLNNKIR